jgi:hypothetical protein
MKPERQFYYKKVQTGGRPRYEPVGEYETQYYESGRAYQFGNHITVVSKNSAITRYNVDPDFASIEAAALIMENELIDVILTASLAEPDASKPFTQEQLDAWHKCEEAFGGRFCIRYPNKFDITRKIMDRIAEKAKEVNTNEATKQAHDNYIMLATLSKDKSK